MELLNRDYFVSIKQLMNLLDVSRSSVMRDLDELEQEGLIVRERGGASLLVSDAKHNEPAVREKEHTNEFQKRKICQMAAMLIKDGDCIFIDSGTTAIYIVDYVLDKNIDIVTPNTYVLSRIPDDFKGNVYVLGGEFKKKSEICCGPLTLEFINHFHFDYAFLTANGIHFTKNEVYSFDFDFAAIKKEALKRSKHKVLLVDRSKFNNQGLCVWASIEQFQSIIVDRFELDIKKPKNVVICE